ncbi:NlpC/P60 family protein [Breoghania sp.]|uniref:C40 family peptidase n=1 Tax=Breoghania sp. TaxID=2065378 RepID=UPI002AAA6C56|nr:NlpC/P60 family protein [Breoghania sp.]
MSKPEPPATASSATATPAKARVPADRRVTPWRPDLAAAHLRERYEAQRYVEGRPARVVVGSAPMRRDPDLSCSLDTELLFGETVTVYEERAGWAWVQNGYDDYVGWVRADALGPVGSHPTHRLSVLRSFLYPEAELRAPALSYLSLGARVCVVDEVEKRGTRYAVLADGSAVIARHLVPDTHFADDWVSVAESFVGVPYLWGARTSIGLDCSALVQIALAESGMFCPRDSDMQERSLGDALDISNGLPGLKRGDLVFWKGHVGIMVDSDILLHANGHTMTTSKEPLAGAMRRIAANEYGAVTAVRRMVRRR